MTHLFSDSDIGRLFKIKVSEVRDYADINPGMTWAREHAGQTVKCLEIDHMQWCALVQAEDETKSGLFRREVEPVIHHD